ncbi:MAG: hypothetical protein ACRCWI_06575 [Brevinema sp.]
MKLLLLQIRIFFAQKEIKFFLKVIFISLPIMLLISYLTFPYILSFFEREDRVKYYERLYEIIDMPGTTNYNLILDDIFLADPNKYPMGEEPDFWTGDAIEYRYTIPKHGVPK